MSKAALVFNFPQTRFVGVNTPEDQIDHVLSKAIEVMRAHTTESIEEEIADLTHSLETYWRIKAKLHGEEYVKGIFAQGVSKNEERGYYAEETP